MNGMGLLRFIGVSLLSGMLGSSMPLSGSRSIDAISFNPTHDPGVYTATVAIANSTERSISIKEVKTSCECVVAQASTASVSPNQVVHIRIELNAHGLFGRVQRRVTVVTDAPRENEHTFELVAELPEPLVLSEEQITWSKGEAADPKTVEIRFGPGWEGKVVGVMSSNPDFKVSWQPDAELAVTTVTIAPTRPLRSGQSVLIVQTDPVLPVGARSTIPVRVE